jgi:putative ABC transport system permease protein
LIHAKLQHLINNSTNMIAFILKSNVRLITRNRVSSIVKLTGFALATAMVLLTLQFCLYEIGFDGQHPNANRIFRYVHRANTPEGMQSFAFTSATTAPALSERYPEVQGYSRILMTRVSLRNPLSDVAFNENRFAFADENFFDFFNFPLQQRGEGVSVLKNPLSLVLSPASAAKYFGKDDPVGKTLILNGELEFAITGVLQDEIEQTHMKFDFIASFASLSAIANNPKVAQQIPASLNLEHKGFNTFYTYLLLSSPSAAGGLVAKFPAFIEEFRGPGRSERLKPTLQSLKSIHLQSDLLYEIQPNGSEKATYAFLFIGLLTLVISCINYVNTSTAEFLKRAQGVGLKKILGINRSTLLLGHLAETSTLVVLSMIIGYLLALLFLPFFNGIVVRNISLFNLQSLYLLMGIFLVTIVLSGIYPAVKISQTNALQAFRGTMELNRFGITFRSALVAFQLLISFCLISIALLVFQQLRYMTNRDMGFSPEQVLVVNATTVDAKQKLAFKERLLNENGIHSVGACSLPPGENLFTYGLSFPQHGEDEDRRIVFYQSFVDENYLAALGIKLSHGRFFSHETPADSDAYVVINRAAVNVLKDSSLVTMFKYKDVFRNKDVTKEIAGVTNDFNFASMHQEISPLMLEYNPGRSGYLLVRFDVKNTQDVLINVELRWKESFAGIPLDYYFLDQRFQALYDDDQRQKKVITLIAVVAVTLAALGIFGTTLFMVDQKTKEVGIRKILGSARSQILMLLLKPTLLLIVCASVIGIPIVLTIGNAWLSQYPYRIEFSSVFFLVSLALLVGVMMVTILHQCYRLTRINPTEVLRQKN